MSSAPRAPSSTPVVPGGTEVFREGELVWYQKEVAWRLGIIRLIQHSSDGSRGRVEIAPLGHTSLRQQDVSNPATMRPFLTFSVPTSSGDDFEGKTYHQIDPPALAAKFARSGVSAEHIGLEASKLAAKMINASFSVFNKGHVMSVGQTTWGGVFLGAERIVLGDVLRVRITKDARNAIANFDYMLVKNIITTGDQLNLLGSVFRLKKAALGEPLPSAQDPDGIFFKEEIQQRNHTTAPRGVVWYWDIMEEEAHLMESDVYSRAYQTDRLMAYIDPATYQQFKSKGEVVDCARYLNMRLQDGQHYEGRKPNRMATVGDSVSSPVQVTGISEEQ